MAEVNRVSWNILQDQCEQEEAKKLEYNFLWCIIYLSRADETECVYEQEELNWKLKLFLIFSNVSVENNGIMMMIRRERMWVREWVKVVLCRMKAKPASLRKAEKINGRDERKIRADACDWRQTQWRNSWIAGKNMSDQSDVLIFACWSERYCESPKLCCVCESDNWY